MYYEGGVIEAINETIVLPSFTYLLPCIWNLLVCNIIIAQLPIINYNYIVAHTWFLKIAFVWLVSVCVCVCVCTCMCVRVHACVHDNY